MPGVLPLFLSIFWDIWKYLSLQIPFSGCYLLLCSRCFNSWKVTTIFPSKNRDVAVSLTFHSSLNCCCNPDSTACLSSHPAPLKANIKLSYLLSLMALVSLHWHWWFDQAHKATDAISLSFPPKLHPCVHFTSLETSHKTYKNRSSGALIQNPRLYLPSPWSGQDNFAGNRGSKCSFPVSEASALFLL